MNMHTWKLQNEVLKTLYTSSALPMNPQPSPSFAALLEQITPENVIQFQSGLPGFPEEKSFVILKNPKELPLAWMQSIVSPKLAFIVTSPFLLFPDYRPDVPDQELAAIGSPALDEILMFCILRVVNATPPELHTNLKAPVIINLRTLAARQIILANEAIYSESAVYRVTAK
jgi:flagellar assembly factor FliW